MFLMEDGRMGASHLLAALKQMPRNLPRYPPSVSSSSSLSSLTLHLSPRTMLRQGLLLLGFLSLFGWSTGKTIVTHLPGYDGRIPFELETGYVEVDELEKENFFYTFVKSERSPAKDPLMLWIIGGPGCSGLAALINEIGPFNVQYNSSDLGGPPVLVIRKESWTKISSIIFVDSPARAGFSYSEAKEENGWSDTKVSKDLHTFIRKWFLDHSEFISNPFYVGGDSYGGKIVPIVTQQIIVGNEDGTKPLLNLKGYVVGNPLTSEKAFDDGTRVKFSHGMGLISDELFQETKESCGGDFVLPSNIRCKKNLDEVQKILNELNEDNILEPRSRFVCTNHDQFLRADKSLIEMKGNQQYPDTYEREGCEEIKCLPTKLWADSIAVREALGVRKEHAREWNTCHLYVRSNYAVDIPSAVPFHLNVTSRGYRSLVYSGDHDLTANFVGTQAWIRSLNSSIVDDWKPWMMDGQVAGYRRTYANNLTFVTVKGAGHIVSFTKPRECWAMIERWLSGKAI